MTSGVAELTAGRDFAVYAAGMDAGLDVKLDDLRAGWAVVPSGGRVLDIGSGTGALLAAVGAERPDLRLSGVDLSPTLLHHSRTRLGAAATLHEADASRLPFPDGTFDALICSSVLHEVYSYGGYDRRRVAQTLTEFARVLRPGGQLAIRDGVAPDGGDRPVWLELIDAATPARFADFRRRFRTTHPLPGVAALQHPCRRHRWQLRLHDAAEFLSKMDYLANWTSELHEEFGVHTLGGWTRVLRAAGFSATAGRSYVHPWVAAHRYRDRVALHTSPGERPLPWPATTAVLHARRAG